MACKKKMIIEVMYKADYYLLCYYMVKTMGEILSEYTQYTENPMVDLLGATPANYILKEKEIKVLLS